MKRVSAALLALVAVVIAATFGVTGGMAGSARTTMHLVNAGPDTTVWGAGGGNCDAFLTPASLSAATGTGLRQESVEGTFFSYVVDTAFTIPKKNAISFKAWWSSGDGTCPGQAGDQVVNWQVTCNGPTCGSTNLTGPRSFTVPAGTVAPTAFSVTGAPPSDVSVGVGDTITIQLGSAEWPVMSWNAPKGVGASFVAIPRT